MTSESERRKSWRRQKLNVTSPKTCNSDCRTVFAGGRSMQLCRTRCGPTDLNVRVRPPEPVRLIMIVVFGVRLHAAPLCKKQTRCQFHQLHVVDILSLAYHLPCTFPTQQAGNSIIGWFVNVPNFQSVNMNMWNSILNAHSFSNQRGIPSLVGSWICLLAALYSSADTSKAGCYTNMPNSKEWMCESMLARSC
jgi:hypothetical protein